MRHASVLIKGNRLLIFYTRVGDAPERILISSVDMSSDWLKWSPCEPLEVMRPDLDYEGVNFQIEPSEHGSCSHVRQLRDPYVFEEGGNRFLFYAVGGEMGISGSDFYLNEFYHL